jgi:hypothetical protein
MDLEATTTIKVYRKNLPWWSKCCRAKDVNSQDAFAEVEKMCKLHHQRKLYDSLPSPVEYVKPLQGIKIKKKYTKNNGV